MLLTLRPDDCALRMVLLFWTIRQEQSSGKLFVAIFASELWVNWNSCVYRWKRSSTVLLIVIIFTFIYFTQLLCKLFVYSLVSIQCWISLRSTLSRKHRVKWKKRSWHHDNSSENSVKFRWSSYGFDGCSVDRNHLFVLTFILLYPFFSAVSPWSRTAWGREVHSTLVVTHASEHWVKRKRWSSHHGNPQETLFSISMMNIFYLMLLDSQIQFYPFWPNCFAVSQRTIQLLMTQHKRNENQPPVRTGGPVMLPTRKGEPAVRTGNSWKQTTCEGNARIPPSYEFSGQASKSPWLLWPNPSYLKQIRSLHWVAWSFTTILHLQFWFVCICLSTLQASVG